MVKTLTTDQTNVQAPPAKVESGKVGLLLVSVILGAIGQLMLKIAVTDIGPLVLSLDALLKMATNPMLILSLAIYGVSACLWLLALMKTDLSFAYPFLSLTYIVVLLGSVIVFKEETSPLRLAGFAVVICGLLIVARDAKRVISKPNA